MPCSFGIILLSRAVMQAPQGMSVQHGAAQEQHNWHWYAASDFLFLLQLHPTKCRYGLIGARMRAGLTAMSACVLAWRKDEQQHSMLGGGSVQLARHTQKEAHRMCRHSCRNPCLCSYLNRAGKPAPTLTSTSAPRTSVL